MASLDEDKETPHCLTHKPADPNCEICRTAKARHRRTLSRGFRRDVKSFGDLVTMDHIDGLDSFGPGVLGGKHVFTIVDIATGFAYSPAVGSKDEETTERERSATF